MKFNSILFLSQIELLNVNEVMADFPEVEYLSQYFSNGYYFSGRLWYLGLGLHRVFRVRTMIVLDNDIRIESDIFKLYSMASLFPPTAVMGLAYELSPGFHFTLRRYREEHPDTRFGNPPPSGHPGYNGGVNVLHLENMRKSSKYAYFLSEAGVRELVSTFYVVPSTNRMADQEFETLMSFLHPELVYTLPCTWNRQLCESWRSTNYNRVFDEYYRCNGVISIYHGNCNTQIPDKNIEEFFDG